ncbi:MAG TPA: YbhB/YbcL family Raf kinase inhibitor-like protein [Candidatus Binataceae bacterium]|nr:YbhB/YbcL family Raf kinase inhibitor-like protein [Candidatus Binataceae bacterium]
MCNRNAYLLIAIFAIAFLTNPKSAAAQHNLTLSSPAFANNTNIPVRFTCSGDGISPALAWSDVPPSAKSIALIVKDPDAPSGNFVHWVIFDIPVSVRAMPEGVPPTARTAFGATQGQNGGGETGYTSPCPPPGKDHHYHFRLYALDDNLNLTSDADAAQVETAMHGHILRQTDLVGIFAR